MADMADMADMELLCETILGHTPVPVSGGKWAALVGDAGYCDRPHWALSNLRFN